MVRIYGYGGTGSTSTANWRIDDLSASAESVVPGPTTYGLILGSLTVVATILFRRRQPAITA